MKLLERLTSPWKATATPTTREIREVYGDAARQGVHHDYHAQVETFAGLPEVYAHVVR